ncbi:hypothetical protein SRHO_G00140110 [Serrasalmus rhombeus]
MMAAHAERFLTARAGNGLRAVGEIKAGAAIRLREIKGGDAQSSAPFAFCVARKFLQSACHNCVRTCGCDLERLPVSVSAAVLRG